MTPDTYDLLDESIECQIDIIRLEDQIGDLLRNADDALRTEIVYYLYDKISRHPALPRGRTVKFEKIEKYVGHLIGVADWHVQCEELADFTDELNQYDYELFSDYEDQVMRDLESDD